MAKSSLSKEDQSLLETQRIHWGISQFAYINNLSEQFVRTQIYEGNLKARKIGSRWLISKEASEEFFKKGSVGGDTNVVDLRS